MPKTVRTTLLALCAVGAIGVVADSASGQSLSTTTIVGSVSTADGRSIGGAILTLSPESGGDGERLTTTATGRFRFLQVYPGTYELRVEAFGFRPLVVRPVTAGGASRQPLALRLTAVRNEPVGIDTLTLAGAASSPLQNAGLRFSGAFLRTLPYRDGDAGTIAALNTVYDESAGAQGLPGEWTRVFIDGVPHYDAPHPIAREERLSVPLVPTGSIASLLALGGAPDVEWVGGAGGYASVTTPAAIGAQGATLEGSYSSGPMWSSDQLSGDIPSHASFGGAASAVMNLSPGRAQALIAADGRRHQTPYRARLPTALVSDLAGLDPDVLGSLSEPSVETQERYAALARVDVRRTATSRVYGRLSFGYVGRTFDGAGPAPTSAPALFPEVTRTFSVAGGFSGQSSPRMDYDVRAGLSGSFRDFTGADDSPPPAQLVGAGVPLGGALSEGGESSRTDFVVLPTLRYTPDVGGGTLKFGALARVSRHTMRYGSPATRDFFFSDGAAVLAGRGFGRTTPGPETTFSTREFGFFLQYDAELAPGLRLRSGARVDFEVFDTNELDPNLDWFNATGLANDSVMTSHRQLGVMGSLTWTPSLEAGTLLSMTGSVHSGDIDTRILYEAFSRDVGALETSAAGSGLGWPTGSAPTANSRSRLALLGPATRPPRTIHLSGGLSQPVGAGLVLFAQGAYRRTDFLVRRRNLNLPAATGTVDAHGRTLFGPVTQDGSLVHAVPSGAMRFSGFGVVWALDPDGWSRYRGVTTGLRFGASAFEAYAAYTRSETTDNWIGARSGLADATLAPGLPGDPATWAEATSDYDVPHRAAVAATLRAGALSIGGLYRFRSGLPFTPGYRYGVDANGDGSAANDVAYVPGDAQIAELLDDWSCLSGMLESFADRNSCRGPNAHSLDLKLEIDGSALFGVNVGLTVEAFDVVSTTDGVRDTALLLVDPAGSITTSSDGGTVTIPTLVNPDFGAVVFPDGRGRLVTVGVRVGT